MTIHASSLAILVAALDRKSVVLGKSVDPGAGRFYKNKDTIRTRTTD